MHYTLHVVKWLHWLTLYFLINPWNALRKKKKSHKLTIYCIYLKEKSSKNCIFFYNIWQPESKNDLFGPIAHPEGILFLKYCFFNDKSGCVFVGQRNRTRNIPPQSGKWTIFSLPGVYKSFTGTLYKALPALFSPSHKTHLVALLCALCMSAEATMPLEKRQRKQRHCQKKLCMCF